MNDNKNGNVVRLPVKEKPHIVMCCTECGCLTFYMNEDGTVDCANCSTRADHATTEWRQELPDPQGDLKTTGGMVADIDMGATDLALERTLRKIDSWADDGELAFLSAYSKDGEGTHFMPVETPEQRAWVLRKLKGVEDMVTSSGNKQEKNDG